MQNLLVHFTHRQHPDQPLRPGVQRIVRHASGSVRLGGDAAGTLLLAQFCLDDRGLWLQVAAGMRGIHVNGRPVRRMAVATCSHRPRSSRQNWASNKVPGVSSPSRTVPEA